MRHGAFSAPEALDDLSPRALGGVAPATRHQHVLVVAREALGYPVLFVSHVGQQQVGELVRRGPVVDEVRERPGRVDEELDRLDTHVKEVRRVLKKGGAVGRRLDFLMQELNREANTLSSKAVVAESTQAAVELKVLIEQMREQIQNIE